MLFDFYRRRIGQALAMRAGSAARFSEIPRRANTVVFYIDHELARTQLLPLTFYRQRIQQEFGRSVCFIPTLALQDRATAGPAPNTGVTRVFLQTPLNCDAASTRQMATSIRASFPNARLCYLDWMAPIDVRHAEVLDPFIDSYITKQTFRDPADFRRAWIGDSNLSDHYFRAMGKPMAEARYGFPEGFESKIILGSNFGFSPQMLDMFARPHPPTGTRDIDFHARIATKGVDWYAFMRKQAYDAAVSIQGIHSVIDGRVKRVKFFAEMRRSKVCFSPFGYGEVCWRDYEAFATGAVLIKPNMDHVRTFPEVFVPGVTYVSLDWDLRDLPERLHELLRDEATRMRISAAAFDVMHRHIREDGPLQPYAEVFARSTR